MAPIPQRLQEYRFGAITLDLSADNLAAQYSNQSVQGEIKKVVFDYNNTTATGSIWLAVSGTGEEVMRINDFSGTSDKFIRYPFVYARNAANATGSPQAIVSPVVNSPLFIAGSGLGGSGLIIDNVIVYYQ